MSKKRFGEIKALIEGTVADSMVAAELLSGIQRIMNYDPVASTCTPAQRKWVQQWRQRKMQETGKTLYELEGGKQKNAARKQEKTSQTCV
jgi:hypothetical protein